MARHAAGYCLLIWRCRYCRLLCASYAATMPCRRCLRQRLCRLLLFFIRFHAAAATLFMLIRYYERDADTRRCALHTADADFAVMPYILPFDAIDMRHGDRGHVLLFSMPLTQYYDVCHAAWLHSCC